MKRKPEVVLTCGHVPTKGYDPQPFAELWYCTQCCEFRYVEGKQPKDQRKCA